jgi:hypothetical protein
LIGVGQFITDITNAIAIGICLIGVASVGAIVQLVRDAIGICIQGSNLCTGCIDLGTR